MADSRPDSGDQPVATTTVDSGSSEVDFHRGEALLSLCRHYPSLMKTLLEMIQNGIDQKASVVFVGIDLDRRQVIVADDGLGTTRESFEEALLSVAKSVKQPGQLGRFGMGLVSPIDKCATYSFSSVPRGEKRGLTWTFCEDDIRGQHHKLEIPVKPVASLPVIASKFRGDLSGAFKGPYQTLIKLNKVTSDRLISQIDLDTLESEIRQNFGEAMLTFDVQVRVALISGGSKEVRDIDPQPFQGDPFEIVSYSDEHAGDVVIELFRAPRQRGKRGGLVSVKMLDNAFGVPMSEFANQARAGTLWEFVHDAVTVLTSGFFEGNIRCQNIELKADRSGFAYNDALHGLYAVLSNWYEEYGQDLYEAEREESDRDRYEELGSQSLERLRDRLPDALWKRFGSSSSEGNDGDDTGGGDQDDPVVQPGSRGGGEGGDKVSTGRSGEAKKPTKPRSTTSGGSGGTRATTVHGSSQGLSFRYDEMPGNTRLWEFEHETGTLILNIRHPVWVLCDETKGKHTARNDRWIMHLQEWLALSLLNLLVSHASTDELDANRELIDRQIKPYVEMFITTKR